jgi:hypothetical protein
MIAICEQVIDTEAEQYCRRSATYELASTKLHLRKKSKKE